MNWGKWFKRHKEPPAGPLGSTLRVGQELYIKYGYTYSKARITQILKAPDDVVVRFMLQSHSSWIGPFSERLADFLASYVPDDPTHSLQEITIA